MLERRHRIILPVHLKWRARQARRQIFALVLGFAVHQPRRDGQLIGHTVEFLGMDAQLAVAFVEERADRHLDDQRKQQDREETAKQPDRRTQRQPHWRVTAALNI